MTAGEVEGEVEEVVSCRYSGDGGLIGGGRSRRNGVWFEGEVFGNRSRGRGSFAWSEIDPL